MSQGLLASIVDAITLNMGSDLKAAICWYKNKGIVANSEKFQPMFVGLKDGIKLCIDINGIVVQMTDSVKLFGVTIDSMLNLNQHAQSICIKASRKVRAVSRIAQNPEYEKNVMLHNSFVLSKFNYCPLIWMFSGKS